MSKLKMLGIAGSMVGTLAVGGQAMAHEGTRVTAPEARRMEADARVVRYRERERERERMRRIHDRLHHHRVTSPWTSR
jgi:hypothetical protein